MTPSSIAALALLLAIAPLLPGLAAKTTAFLTGRRGAPLLQPYSDLARLLGKGAVYSSATTALFRLAPLVLLGTALIAAVLLPLDGRSAPLSFEGDLLAFAGLLALGHTMLALAGLDTGSSFEGMGVSRLLAFAVFVEPALFLCFAALALGTGEITLSNMLGPSLAGAWIQAPATLAMVAVSLFISLLAVASRVPVDDPATHLELTMIHEVTVLDASGPDLAFIDYASALKFALFGALVVGTVVPRAGMPPPLALAALAAGLLAVALLVGVIESSMARLRLVHVPQLLVGSSALAALGLILLLR